jgi:hypothetical protein
MRSYRRSIIAAMLLGGLTIMTCAAEPEQNVTHGEPFTMAINDQVVLNGSDLRITFDSVSEDSRCPKGTHCLWAGRVVVLVQLSEAAEQETTVALALPESPTHPASAQWRGHTLRLEKVSPYPDAEQQIEAGDYQATLRLE